MKKILSAIVSIAMLIGTFPILNASAEVTSLAGSGTSSDPYKISNKAELEFMRDQNNKGGGTKPSVCYELTADIDLGGAEWEPIGLVEANLFDGKFNGNNHVIKNFKITDTSAGNQNVGFFGLTGFAAQITNLGIEKADINLTTSTRDKRVGIFIGYAYGGTYTDCYVKNSSFYSKENIWGVDGLFVGEVRSQTTFTNCYVHNIDFYDGMDSTDVGGFVGRLMNNAQASKLDYCYVGKINVNSNTCSTIYPVGKRGGNLQEMPSIIVASSLTPVNGTYRPSSQTANKNFIPNESIGGESCTYEAIVAKMVDGKSHFKVDERINDGWPCLVTEHFTVTALKGTGAELDPYLISDAEELVFARDKINSDESYRTASYALTADIDLGGITWTPIGSKSARFKGNFFGNRHVVSNFKVSTDAAGAAGFFGGTESSTVTDLGIENATISSNLEKGGMVGNGSGTFENCFVRNVTIEGRDRWDMYSGDTAGFIGGIRLSSTFKNCYVYDATLMGGVVNAAGFGIPANTAASVTLENCYTAEIKSVKKQSSKAALYPLICGKWDDVTTYNIINSYASDAGAKGINGETIPNRIEEANKNVNYASNEDPTASVCQTPKATIVSALTAVEGYKSDSINGGYPSFTWDIPEAEDTTPYMVSAVAPGVGTSYYYQQDPTTDYEIKVKLETTKTVPNAKVYVATYDGDGRLIDAYKGNATVNTEIATGIQSTDAVTVKVFVWDAKNTPVADAYIGEPQLSGQLKQYVTVKGSEGTGEYVPNAKTRLIMMGDSIMDSVSNSIGSEYTWQKTGWELYMPELLTDDIEVVKHGHSGWSIGDFMMGSAGNQHCNWNTIKGQFRKGDYIILALGINDSGRISEYMDAKAAAEAKGETFNENGGVNPNNNRVWYSQDQFKEMYKTLIADAKAKGATVILTTPTPGSRRSQDGPYTANTYALTKPIIEEVATETGTLLVDLTALFCNTLNGYINDGTYTYDQIRPQYAGDTMTGPGVVYSDGIHMTDFGARLIATLVTNALKKMNTGIEEYIDMSATVMPNPLPNF